MKKRNLLTLFVFNLTMASMSFGQCLDIVCPADIVIASDANCEAIVTYVEPVGADTCAPLVHYNFTNCNATGQFGPNQTQVSSAYASTTLDNAVLSVSGVQFWVVPVTNTYSIEAIGAMGGGVSGGLGASMMGEFSLTAGDTLGIIVGQMGMNGGDGSTTAGGGSFVVKVDNTSSTVMTSTGLKVTPLIIAGGGGGNPGVVDPLSDASISTTGNIGAGGTGFGAGGTAGNGGKISVSSGNSRGGGGGGFLTDGERTNTCGTGGQESGSSFLNGGNGGLSVSCSTPYPGGFGGGGGSISSGWRSSGGGGGYSGGGAGQTNSVATNHRGGGGASFNSGLNPTNTAGIGNGHGQVNIISQGTSVTTTQTAGMGTGATFPLGVTTETFEVTDGVSTFSCSFNVTVVDTPATFIASFIEDTICSSSLPVPLPSGFPVGGTYSGTGVSGTVFDPSVSGIGTFVITYTDATGCSSSAHTSITVQSCVGISEINSNQVRVYPNPGNGTYKLEGNEGDILKLMVYNTLGKLILTETNWEDQKRLDLTSHPNGIYLLMVETSRGNATYQLIKR